MSRVPVKVSVFSGAVHLTINLGLLHQTQSSINGRGTCTYTLALWLAGKQCCLCIFRVLSLAQQSLVALPCILHTTITSDDPSAQYVYILGNTVQRDLAQALAGRSNKDASPMAVSDVKFSAVDGYDNPLAPQKISLSRSVVISFSDAQVQSMLKIQVLKDVGLAQEHMMMFWTGDFLTKIPTVRLYIVIPGEQFQYIKDIERAPQMQPRNLRIVLGADKKLEFKYQNSTSTGDSVVETLHTELEPHVYHKDIDQMYFSRFASRIPGEPQMVHVWVFKTSTEDLGFKSESSISGYIYVLATYKTVNNSHPRRYSYSEATLQINFGDADDPCDVNRTIETWEGRRKRQIARQPLTPLESESLKRLEATGQPPNRKRKQ